MADRHLELLLFITILIFNLRFCPCGGLTLKFHRELRAVFGPERKGPGGAAGAAPPLLPNEGRVRLFANSLFPHCCPRDF